MGEYQPLPATQGFKAEEKPGKVPDSLRGAVLRIEAEIDALIGQLLGQIQQLETIENVNDEEFVTCKRSSSSILNKVEGKVSEVGDYGAE